MANEAEAKVEDTPVKPVGDDNTMSASDDTPAADKAFTTGKGWRFWAIFPSLMITTLLSAMEVTVVSTALPTIVHELHIGKDYVWIVNAFVLTRSVFIQSQFP